MKVMFFDGENYKGPDQRVKGLGYINKNGKNFLPAILRTEEFLSGKLKKNPWTRGMK
jgi:hypothetical protein